MNVKVIESNSNNTFLHSNKVHFLIDINILATRIHFIATYENYYYFANYDIRII